MTDAECDELYMTLHCIILETAIEQEWRAVVHEPSQYTRVSSTTDVNYTNGKIFRHIKRLFPIVNHLTPQETWLIGAIATKFDALAFSKFYATIVAGILLEEWSPSGLDAGLYKRNCRVRERLKGSFSLSRSQDGTASVTFMDLERVQKICGLREAGRTLFRKLKCLQDIKISKKQEITRYWHHAFSAASTFDELLDEDKEAFNALFHVIAHVVFSVFDNPTTLERAKSLLRKVPISFITTSLYFMNPSRFLGQALRLYMWAPAEGIASLCQRLAGALCGYIQTRADYHRLLIQSKNEEWFEPVHQCFHNSNMSSMDPDHKYAEMLQNNNVDYSKKVLTFCRLHYRFHEKKLFVEHFTGVGDTSFIDFLGETLPEILNELQKAGSLSTLVSNFFGLLSNILTEVEKNSIVNKESIEKVVTLITEFMRYFYQYLHYAETKRDTAEGMPLFSSVIDIIFGTVLRLDDVETFHSCLGDFTYHQKVKNFVRSLNKNDSDSLWEFLRKARLEAENARLGTVAHQQIDYLVSLLVDTICID